jgi:hypothetical protein
MDPAARKRKCVHTVPDRFLASNQTIAELPMSKTANLSASLIHNSLPVSKEVTHYGTC